RIGLIEDERWRRAARGKHDLQRKDEAGKLAARGDLHQGTGVGAGIGPDPKGHAVDAARAALGKLDRFDMGGEARLVELERTGLARDLAVEPRRRLFSRRA